MSKQAKALLVILTGIFLAVGVYSFCAPSRAHDHKESYSVLREKVAKYIRERFGVPQNVKLTVGDFHSSFDPHLYEVDVFVENGKIRRDQKVFVSRDGNYLIVGQAYNLAHDPVAVAMHTISTVDQPSQGPRNAPVTIVEYADLECPTCARLNEFMEKKLVPKYGGKIRIIFKDFPLVAIHAWAQTGAIATQCAYRTDPSAYVAYRSLIFENQVNINPGNARDMLLNLASQAGINAVKLAACLDSKATLPRVEADMMEGKKLGISSTPTSYVNGRMIVGLPSPEAYYGLIDRMLAASR